MCEMVEQSEAIRKDNDSQNGLHQHISAMENGGSLPDQNESVLAVAHELAIAGDELTRRFSANNKKNDNLWDDVKLYAFIIAFRLMFGLI